MKRKINGIMVLMSAIGGVIAFLVGEVLIKLYQYSLPSFVLMGLYFGIFAFIIGLMCIFAEIIYPKINGQGWKNNYLSTSFKFLIPCTLIAVFIFTALFQYIYERSFMQKKVINDVVVLMDTSGSMSNTDPKNQRFDALGHLLDSMNKENRVSVYGFSNAAVKIEPMEKVTTDTKETIMEGIDKYKVPSGNTNMKDALDKCIEEINNSKENGRNSMVIMLSDGGDNYNLDKKFDETMKPFKDAGIPVYSIGMTSGNNFLMLKNIAKASDGNYYNVKDVKDLKNAFVKIYQDRQQSLLNDKRNGIYNGSLLYGILRVLFITLLVAIMAASISFVFDNRYLLKGFIIGGIIAGFSAGLILELGLNSTPWMVSGYRFAADIIMSVVFTLFAAGDDYVRKDSNKSFIKKYTSKNSSSNFNNEGITSKSKFN